MEKLEITVTPITREQLEYLKNTVAEETEGKSASDYDDSMVIEAAVHTMAMSLLEATMKAEMAKVLVEVIPVVENVMRELGVDDVVPEPGDLKA